MYVERYGHVDAWVASTPIADMVAGLQQALPAVIRRRPDGAPQRFLVSLAARLNPVRAITLAKYERQFGADGIHGALRVLKAVGPVDLARIDAPLLALVGASEDAEFRRQAHQVHQAVRQRRPESRLIEFAPDTGADAHCQVNNRHSPSLTPSHGSTTSAWRRPGTWTASSQNHRTPAREPRTAQIEDDVRRLRTSALGGSATSPARLDPVDDTLSTRSGPRPSAERAFCRRTGHGSRAARR